MPTLPPNRSSIPTICTCVLCSGPLQHAVDILHYRGRASPELGRVFQKMKDVIML